ncbi:MAG: hypothetical protein Tsb0020_38930 [Haliangiales bacterium]
MQTRTGQMPPVKSAPPVVVQKKADGSNAEPLPFAGISRDAAEWAFLPHTSSSASDVARQAPVQARGERAGTEADAASPSRSEQVHEAAAAGVIGSGSALPYAERIQAAFGPAHDVSHVQAHVGGDAAAASEAIGAKAYATGDHIGFRDAPDLHTAAHEAAHVVQQQQGVALQGGVGQVGDVYERHADAVADRVVAGQSAAELLAAGPAGGGQVTGAAQSAHDPEAPVQGGWLGAGVGLLGGATAGASIGAVAGPVGAAVGGVVGAVAGAIGGHLVEEAGSSSTVLSDDTVDAVEQAINEGRKQDAIDAIVADLSAQGLIDTSLLQGAGITYDASVGGEGVANPPGYDASGAAQPTDVRIGDAAFTGGVTLLHTSIMHEYWHVEQFQEAGSSSSVVPGQGGGSLIDQQEVEAYCWEIEHAEDTGLASEPAMMEDAWNRLHNNYWVNLSAGDKAPLLDQVTRCHQIAERVTDKTLVFTP